MEALKPVGASLAEELVRSLGKDQVEAYGKAAIVGVNGEMEHGAVWHEAGGWAMREALGEPKAIVPSVKAVACAGYRLMVPLHHVRAAYVRSHFSSVEIGIQDAPRPTRSCSRWSCRTAGASIREWAASRPTDRGERRPALAPAARRRTPALQALSALPAALASLPSMRSTSQGWRFSSSASSLRRMALRTTIEPT
jgi:hypothetical protein